MLLFIFPLLLFKFLLFRNSFWFKEELQKLEQSYLETMQISWLISTQTCAHPLAYIGGFAYNNDIVVF